MAKLLKLRRGTTSQHSSFTGAEGEVTVDTTKDTIVVHDGSTAGGVPLAKESDNLSLIDEDNMATDSNTRPPSQQSVKAYVDAKVPTSITVADESSDTTCFPLFVTAATGDLAPKSGTNITFNSSTGLLSATAVTTTGNVTVGGNLQVDGTTTTVNSATLNVTDKNIVMAKGAANDAAADGGGITVESGGGDKTLNWVDATDAWTSSEHVHLLDNKKLHVGGASGTTDGLEVYHNTSDSYITNTGTGNLIIKGHDVHIQGSNGENMINCNEDGSVDLSHNNIKTVMTSANGLKVLGPEGGNAEIQINSDEGDDNADFWKIENVASDNTLIFQNYTTGSYTTTLKLNPNGALEDSKGDVRKIPQNHKTGAYVLLASDAGKCITITTGGVTVNQNVFTAGDAVTIVNHSGSDQTITQGSSFTLHNTADAATGNRTLAGRGMATIWFENVNEAYISGAGLS